MGHHGLTGTPTGHVPQTQPNCRLRQPAVRLPGIEEGLVTLVLGKKGQSWHHTSPYTTPQEHCPLGQCLQPTWQDGQQLWRRTGSVPSVPGFSLSVTITIHLLRCRNQIRPPKINSPDSPGPPESPGSSTPSGSLPPSESCSRFQWGACVPAPTPPPGPSGWAGQFPPLPSAHRLVQRRTSPPTCTEPL